AAGKPAVVVRIVPEDQESDTILEGVSRGSIGYSVADDLLANIHTAYWDNLVVGPPISDERDVAWAVRPGDARLRKVVNDVFRELRRKPDFNVLRKKYFEAERSLRRERGDRFYASETGTLSPYDPLVR